MTKRTQLLTTAALSLLAAATLPSCTAPASKPSDPPPASSPSTHGTTQTSQPIGAHWVHDRQLRQVMARLSQQKPSMPANVPDEPESPKSATPEDFNAVSLLAGQLMTAADQIPAVADKLKMTEADRAGFLAEAHTLHDQAQRLRDAARKQRIEQMQRDMDAINATCISCHSRYRDFSGQLNTTQSLLPLIHPQYQASTQ